MADVMEQFEAIAEDAGNRAARVKCGLTEYVEGLETIIEHLEMLKEGAEVDLRRREQAGE